MLKITAYIMTIVRLTSKVAIYRASDHLTGTNKTIFIQIDTILIPIASIHRFHLVTPMNPSTQIFIKAEIKTRITCNTAHMSRLKTHRILSKKYLQRRVKKMS